MQATDDDPSPDIPIVRQPWFVRWIPLVVPLAALFLVAAVFLIAAEML